MDKNLQFHAGRLLENPAYKQALADERAAIERELHELDPWATQERCALSNQLTMLRNLERRWARMSETGRIEQFHLQQRKRAV